MLNDSKSENKKSATTMTTIPTTATTKTRRATAMERAIRCLGADEARSNPKRLKLVVDSYRSEDRKRSVEHRMWKRLFNESEPQGPIFDEIRGLARDHVVRRQVYILHAGGMLTRGSLNLKECARDLRLSTRFGEGDRIERRGEEFFTGVSAKERARRVRVFAREQWRHFHRTYATVDPSRADSVTVASIVESVATGRHPLTFSQTQFHVNDLSRAVAKLFRSGHFGDAKDRARAAHDRLWSVAVVLSPSFARITPQHLEDALAILRLTKKYATKTAAKNGGAT